MFYRVSFGVCVYETIWTGKVFHCSRPQAFASNQKLFVLKRDCQPHCSNALVFSHNTTTGKVLICYFRSLSPGKRVHVTAK